MQDFSLLLDAILVLRDFSMCLNVNLMVDFSFKCFQIRCVNSHLLVFEEDSFCFLPFETFAGTSMCQNYLNDFHAGIWDATHEVFLFHIHLHTKRTLWHYSCWYASSWLWNPSDSVPLLISWQSKFTVVLLLILLIHCATMEGQGALWFQMNTVLKLCFLFVFFALLSLRLKCLGLPK